MAAEASKSSSSADSYIGSVISLTSKSEIRYEGVLYSINAEESSIGLRNVRSFGSEGRKKDGPQIPPSDRVYEFILFCGTDIKDLEVKSAPPAQATSMDNDPAIIQSHYPPPPATSTTFSAAASVAPTDLNFPTPQMGNPGSNFPGGMPLYHHGASLGSWGPSPPPLNGNSLPVPVYWSGMYGLPNTLPHLHQQTFLQPHPGLSVPPTLQQPMPYSSMNAPPQAAAPNVASSSSTLPASSSSTNMGFNPPPLAVAMNGPTSSSPLIAATSSSTALTSSSFPSSSLLVVPPLQQSILYSGFSAPAPAAFIKGPSSSSMPYTTNSSSAILGYNPPPPSLAMSVPTSGAIKMPSSSSMPFTTNSISAILGYSPPQPALAMNVQTSGSPLLACSSSSTPLTSSSLPSLSLPVVPSLSVAPQTNSSSVFDKGLNPVHSSEAKHVGLPTFVALTVSDSETIRVNPPSSTKVNTVSCSTILPCKNSSQAEPSVLSSLTPSQKEVPIPSLVTPGQLLQSKKSETSSHSSQVAHKDVQVIQVSSSTKQSVLVPKEKEAQLPILPLPPAPRPYHKPNGSPQVRHNYRGSGRGRGRGRGTGGSRPVTRFMEDFDFSAMNERFNKDEVWDHLGKSNKIHSNDKEGDEIDEDANEDEDDAELPKIEVKPVYNKDDFFDTLSSNVRDNESQKPRPRFSEQLKLDTETFGEFARHRGGRGPGRGGRGFNYGRGSSYGRSGTSGTGRGYGRAGRGRERAVLSQAS